MSEAKNDGCNQQDSKTPMRRLCDLAKRNNLNHFYKLVDEAGPAHQKHFTVSVVLAEGEEYFGEGASIKKAQQAAALHALQNTRYSLARGGNRFAPPTNVSSTPAPQQALSKLADRLNLRLVFEQLSPIAVPSRPFFPPPPSLLPNIATLHSWPHACYPPHVPYFCVLADGVPTAVHVQPPPPPPILPSFLPPPVYIEEQRVRLHLCGATNGAPRRNGGSVHQHFDGVGATAVLARADAARRALRFIQQRLLLPQRADGEGGERESPTSAANGAENSADAALSLAQPVREKSKISLVHEIVVKLKLNLTFETVSDFGPNHKKAYTMRCCVFERRPTAEKDGPSEGPTAVCYVTEGSGASKKRARELACARMVEELRRRDAAVVNALERTAMAEEGNGEEDGHEKGRKKKVAMRKKSLLVKDLTVCPNYGSSINPVSRLVQICQARGDEEPQFTLLNESGHARNKEFVYEARIGDIVVEGSGGPNKRLAKRVAAELLLVRLGLAKPAPTPRKPAIKPTANRRRNRVVQSSEASPADWPVELAALAALFDHCVVDIPDACETPPAAEDEDADSEPADEPVESPEGLPQGGGDEESAKRRTVRVQFADDDEKAIAAAKRAGD